jgi:hypothetical protein
MRRESQKLTDCEVAFRDEVSNCEGQMQGNATYSLAVKSTVRIAE